MYIVEEKRVDSGPTGQWYKVSGQFVFAEDAAAMIPHYQRYDIVWCLNGQKPKREYRVTKTRF